MPGAIIAPCRCPHMGPASGFILVASIVEPFTPSLASHLTALSPIIIRQPPAHQTG